METGTLPVDEVRALFPDTDVDDDGVSLTISTHNPALVLSTLAERNALRGLSVRGATLEDVFLSLTGHEIRDSELDQKDQMLQDMGRWRR